jgi:hypothetical protein
MFTRVYITGEKVNDSELNSSNYNSQGSGCPALGPSLGCNSQEGCLAMVRQMFVTGVEELDE